jgi:hypothetical protein
LVSAVVTVELPLWNLMDLDSNSKMDLQVLSHASVERATLLDDMLNLNALSAKVLEAAALLYRQVSVEACCSL